MSKETTEKSTVYNKWLTKEEYEKIKALFSYDVPKSAIEKITGRSNSVIGYIDSSKSFEEYKAGNRERIARSKARRNEQRSQEDDFAKKLKEITQPNESAPDEPETKSVSFDAKAQQQLAEVITQRVMSAIEKTYKLKRRKGEL